MKQEELKKIIAEELDTFRTLVDEDEKFRRSLAESGIILEDIENEEQLNEVGLSLSTGGIAGWLFRVYKWGPWLLKVLGEWKAVPAQLRPFFTQLGEASMILIELENELKKNKKAYMAIMGPLLLADPVGAAAGEGKAMVLKKIYQNMFIALRLEPLHTQEPMETLQISGLKSSI